MKMLRFTVIFAALWICSNQVFAAILAESSQPAITGVQIQGSNLVVHATVPPGVIKLTLQGRSRVDGSAWSPRAVLRLDGKADEVQFEVNRTAEVEILRLQASYSDLPATFFKGTNSFAAGADAGNRGVVLGPTDAGAGSADMVREVVESDIWQLDGDRLYFFNQYRGLQVMDVSDATAPRILGQVSLAASGEQMYVIGGHHAVLLARDGCNSSSNHVVIVDVRSSIPTIVQSLPVAGWIQESRLVGNALYVASQNYFPSSTNASVWESGTVVSSFDLADPAHPVTQKTLWFPAAYSTTVQATDKFLFVITSENWNESAVQIIDISAPDGVMESLSKIQTAGRIDDKFKIHMSGDVLTTISMRWGNPGSTLTVLETFSMLNPRKPEPLGSLELGKGEQLHATQFDGDRVYIVTFFRKDPLWIVDLADPARPHITGELQVPGWSTYIKPLGDRLVSIGVDPTNDWRVTVSLFNVADAAAPSLLSRVALGENYSWSEANYDEKAFNVLPDDGLILLPYAGYLTNGYTQRMQLVDFNRDALKVRGSIEHDMTPRRATVHRDSVLSISGRDLLSVNISDRDQPVIKADLPLSWTVDRILVKDAYLIEVENGAAWYYNGTQPTLRIADAANPEGVLNALTLSNAWPIVGAEVHGNVLYIAQASSASPNQMWFFPVVTTTDGDTTNIIQNPILLTTAFDLTQLPKVSAAASVQTELSSNNYVSDLRPLWPRDNLLIWANTTSFYPWIFMGANTMIPGLWRPWGGFGGASAFYAIDTSSPLSPEVRATLNLSSNSWSMSNPLVVNGLIYVSHQSFDLVRLPLPSGSISDGAKSGATDSTNTVQTTYDYSITRNYLDVLDFSDPKDPVARKPVNIPGSLIGASADGALLYTTGSHWTTNTLDAWIEWLDASAYDGVAAYLLDSVQLPVQWPHPITVFGTNICLGVPATTNAPDQLQILALDSKGKFTSRQGLKLENSAQQLEVAGKFLLLQTGTDLKLYTNSPDAIISAGGGTGTSCYYYFQPNKAATGESGVWLPLGDYGVLKINASK
ncbi:MAG: hypothetical protein JWM99_1975 [Verrucomicrobiales bacterium]|nr:hypothetical protein [Verrucomicrobiales bacterium]